jgi:hypothetical protein
MSEETKAKPAKVVEVVEGKKKVEVVEEKPKAEYKGNYIMKVTHLAWGRSGKNHFFADKKPEINAKVMGQYSSILKIWLDNNWIEKGSYE